MFIMVEPEYRPGVNQGWGERILNSTTSLAKDLFNGPDSGIDVAYQFAGKAAAETQASRTVASGAIPRRRQSGAILACDFRRLREAEEKSQRELQFKRFAESGVGSWKDSESQGMCGGYAEMQARGEEPERTKTSEELRQQGSQETFESRWPSDVISPPAPMMNEWPSTVQHRTSEVHKNDIWQNLDEVEEIWSRSKSAAVSRLQQIQYHLSPDPQKPTRKHILRPIQPLPEDLESFQALLQTIQVQPSKADANNLDITYFHCPHMECHRRLEQQNANLPVELETRACVHTGCGFVGRSVQEWVLHCTVGEHHGEERLGEGERGLCGRCVSVEDTHF